MTGGPDSGGTTSGGSGTPSGTTTTSAAASVGTDAVTGTTTETTLTPIPVDVLEFEDTLFHDDSAVMLPEVPGLDATADNAPMTGVKAVGMAFLFAELYPERGMLITGHTASQSDIQDSFRISRERASGIMYLLQGNAGRWATTCAGRQTIRDYKQILKYLHEYTGEWKDGNWGCDPGDVDNSFNDATENALTNFAQHFNSDIADGSDDISDLPFTLGEIVLEATDNRLSTAHWRAIYHVYELMVCDFLGKTRTELADMRLNLHWVSDTVKMVGCGHSYAVPDSERGDDKIRSETDSRVELLIYQGNAQEQTAMVVCPTLSTRELHNLENDCPMWHDRHFTRYYVGPGDRFAVVYHLKFRYYDRVKKDFQDIPGRVNVKAYKRDATAGAASEDIPCITQYQNGIHTVRIRFSEENPDFTGKWLYFGFEAPEHESTPVVRMIHTSGPDATPVIVNRPDDWDTKTFAQKYQYYDLPMEWSSHNYFTRHESTPANDERFHEHIKDKRELKPYGANVTALDQPLMFSFDDIVLFDAANTHDQNIQDGNQAGTVKALCAGGANPGSRVKLFVVDPDTHCLKLWQKPDDDYTSAPPPASDAPAPSSAGSLITTPKQERIRFERNLVTGMAPNAKIIHFRDDFYTISDQRTTNQPANWMDLTHKPVLGARKAIRDDTNVHLKWDRNVTGTPLGYTGDYELHYFHRLYLEDDHPVSFMIVYLTMNIILSAKGAQSRTAWSAVAENSDMDDISNFVNTGVYNANDRWNQKHFFYDETTTSDSSLLIKPFYFFDERETFEIPLADAPTGINHRTRAQVTGIFTNAGFVAAETAAFGGPVKWITVVTPESDGSWAWSIRSNTCAHSIMSVRKSIYTHPTGNFAFQTGGYSEDGDSCNCFVFAHELGHATSLQDEYIKNENVNIGGTTRSYYAYSQNLIQYTMGPNNEASIMYYCGAPRLHYCWYHLHFLNTTIQAIPTGDAHILKNRTFALRYKHGTKDHIYSRNVNWTPGGGAPVVGSASIKSDIRDPVIKEGQARLPNFVSVSTAPDLTTLTVAQQGKVSFNATGNILTWTDNGVMSDADRDALRGLFAADANKNKVTNLQLKTRSVRRLNLALYDVGQDESSRGESTSKGCFTTDQNNYRYYGVLVVRVMIGGDLGTPAMTAANAHAKLGYIRAAWVTMNQKYRLTGGPDEIENVYVHFIPGFKTQANVGTEANYEMQFVTKYTKILTGTIDRGALEVGLRSKVTYTVGTHALSYNGVMTTAHRDALIAAVGGGDRPKIETLYQNSNLISTDGTIVSAQLWRGTELRNHFLNMQTGETELAALKFLETWINDKLSASYTLEQIPSVSP